MRAYRAKLLAAGRLLEARAVDHCMTLASKPARQIGAGAANDTPSAATAPASSNGGAWTVLGDW
jgi:hypothetical protein